MDKEILAVMPGLVARVNVKKGDKVEKGQVVVVINCMKNEIEVVSEHAGTVNDIFVKEWDELEVDNVMMTLGV